MAVDLLAQRADRLLLVVPVLTGSRRATGPTRRSTCPGWRWSRPACSGSSGGSCAATRRAGRARRSSRRWRRARCSWAASSLGAARPGADAPHALLPLALVLGGQRGDLLRVGALFCGVFFMAQFLQTGLGRAARGRARPAAVDGDALLRGAGGGDAGRPLGERPFLVLGPLLQAAGLGWIALIAEAGMPYAGWWRR